MANLFEKFPSQCSGITYTFRLLAQFSFDLGSYAEPFQRLWPISLKNAQVYFP
jgi:hypothetical protein